MSPEPVVTVEEAATLLGVSPATVKRRCGTGEIKAQRVGRSWLIDATALPSAGPVQTRRRRVSASASSLVDLHLSLQHLRSQDLQRDLWVPDILRYEDDLLNTDSLMDAAAAKLDLNERFEPPVNIPVPKSPFFLRNAVNLSLSDRLAYHAAVESVSVPLAAAAGSCAYSARLARSDKFFLEFGSEAWVRWKAAVQAKTAELDGFVVETDVTAFFDCVSHTVLMQELQDLALPKPVLDALREMLRTWESAPNTGIPQGPDASRLLGNFYMTAIDSVITTLPDVHYFRYMDDIRIVSPSRHSAVEALKVLDTECRKRNLSLSTKKTALRHGKDAFDALEDLKINAAKYAFDAGGDPKAVRKQMGDLFRAALRPDGTIDARRAKFSIYRLRALREANVRGLVLRNLESLAGLGWLVPAYLQPWMRRPPVTRDLSDYLENPERNTSDYLSTWLLAALLDDPACVTDRLRDYARRISFDRSESSYHRAVALQVLAVRSVPQDITAIRGVASREYDPEVVRGALVALYRAGKLDRSTASKAERIAGLEITNLYLRGRNNLPSMILREKRSPIIKL